MKKVLLFILYTSQALVMALKVQKIRRTVHRQMGIYPDALVCIDGHPVLYARRGERGFSPLSSLTETEKLRLQGLKPAISYTLED